MCFRTTAAADMIVDINAVVRRRHHLVPQPTDRHPHRDRPRSNCPASVRCPCGRRTRRSPALSGIAALTGQPAGADVTRPADRGGQDRQLPARPAAVGPRAGRRRDRAERRRRVTAFVALFQTNLAEVGPVRSARTSDLDLLTAMNRPVFGYSGANVGVNAWIRSAAEFGRARRLHRATQPVLPPDRRSTGAAQPALRRRRAPSDIATTAGPGAAAVGHRPARGHLRVGATCDGRHDVPRDRWTGSAIDWTWDPTSGDVPAIAGRCRTPRRVRRPDRRPTTWWSCSSSHVPSPVDNRSPNPITVGIRTRGRPS